MSPQMNFRELDMSDVKAGDVLLSYGTGLLSEVIRLVDGGDYSHSAFFDGEEVIEARLKGVVRTPLETEVRMQEYVDVYRFNSDDQTIGELAWRVAPLKEVAHNYVGREYADNQLFLIGMLIVIRQLPHDHLERQVLRTVIALVYKLFQNILDDGEKVVTCSELVYRIFYEAKPSPKYRLAIRGTLGDRTSQLNSLAEHGPQQTEPMDSESEKKVEEIKRMYSHVHKELADDLPDVKNKIGSILSGSRAIVAADLVSPRDLQLSPSLKFIGRIKKPDTSRRL